MQPDNKANMNASIQFSSLSISTYSLQHTFWWRCAWGTHPFSSRTRWLRPKRPMVLYWRRYGRAGGCRNPFKNKSKTLSYIKYHLQRCLYTLVFTSDPSSESFWSWMTDKSSVKWYLENWTLKIISSINIELVRDRRISNNEIGRWKEVTFRSSKTRDIRGHWVTSMEKQSNLRTTRSAEQRYAKQTRRE